MMKGFDIGTCNWWYCVSDVLWKTAGSTPPPSGPVTSACSCLLLVDWPFSIIRVMSYFTILCSLLELATYNEL